MTPTIVPPLNICRGGLIEVSWWWWWGWWWDTLRLWLAKEIKPSYSLHIGTRINAALLTPGTSWYLIYYYLYCFPGTGSDEYLSPNDFKATDDNYQSVDIPKQESMCSETEENLTANHVVTEEYGNSHFPPDIKTSQLHQEAQSFISEDNLNGWPRSPDFEDPVSRASHVQFLDNS